MRAIYRGSRVSEKDGLTSHFGALNAQWMLLKMSLSRLLTTLVVPLALPTSKPFTRGRTNRFIIINISKWW